MSLAQRNNYPISSVTCALFYGITAGLAGGLWCVAGAGMYGSPFPLETRWENLFYALMILVGPGLSIVAGFLALARPRQAGWVYLLGGLLSLGFSASIITTDAGPLPLVLIVVPILILGGMLLKNSHCAQDVVITNAHTSRSHPASIMVGAGLFLVGLVGMFVLAGYVNIENVFGFRQQAVMFGFDYDKPADTFATLVLLGATLLLVPVVWWLKLRWEALVGMWIALALSLVIIWMR